ncbi:hypothetical protein BH11BAC1_BH11BAC1_26320 [soil metagenome]
MTDQRSFAGRFHLWFNLIMMAVYAFVGILLIFILHFDSLPALNTKMMGGVLIFYAAFRGYKLYKTFSVRTDTDQAHANQ